MHAWVPAQGTSSPCKQPEPPFPSHYLTLSHLPPLRHPQYNEGWNRLTCSSCDSAAGSITTSAAGSITSDQCIVPAGYGATRVTSGGYTGFVCPTDTYGRPNVTTGLVEVTW